MSVLIPAVHSADHMLGPASASIVIVEFGDFQCPYCGAAYPELKAVKRALGDSLCFVFRNFPLVQVHAHALAAAEFAEAAASEGKFWQMHDMLYEHQNRLDEASLIHYAQEVGLSKATIEAAIQGRFREKVRQDLESGMQSGVRGTPQLYINGQQWEGPATADALLDALSR